MPYTRTRICHCTCIYLWDWYYMWTIRSRILKIGSILLLLAFVIDLLALMTGYWLTGPEGNMGLFDHLTNGTVGLNLTVPVICPILAILSAVILFCDNILNMLFVTRRFHIVMPAVIVFAFIGALMMMTVIVTWSVPYVTMGRTLSWSFILAILAVVIDMAGCGMCVMEFLNRRQRLPPIIAINERLVEEMSSPSHEESVQLRTTSDSHSRENIDEIELQPL